MRKNNSVSLKHLMKIIYDKYKHNPSICNYFLKGLSGKENKRVIRKRFQQYRKSEDMIEDLFKRKSNGEDISKDIQNPKIYHVVFDETIVNLIADMKNKYL